MTLKAYLFINSYKYLMDESDGFFDHLRDEVFISRLKIKP